MWWHQEVGPLRGQLYSDEGLRMEAPQWGCYCYSIARSCPTLCNTMDCSMPGFPVLHYLPDFSQTHVHWVSDAIQPSYSLSPLSPPALNLSQHQGLFKWVSSLHQVAQVLEFQEGIRLLTKYRLKPIFLILLFCMLLLSNSALDTAVKKWYMKTTVTLPNKP